MCRYANRISAFAMSLLMLPGLGFVHVGPASAANPTYNNQSKISEPEGASSGLSHGHRPETQSNSSQNREMTQEAAPGVHDEAGSQTDEHSKKHHEPHSQAQGDQNTAKSYKPY
jgi:uncharacterized protein involved in copper resistance